VSRLVVAAARTVGCVGLALSTALEAQETVLYESSNFTVRSGSVQQGPFAARALGRDTLRSTYPRAAQEVRFKFGVGGGDNEFAPGTEHTIYLRPRQGVVATTPYVFGVPPTPRRPRPTDAAEGEDGDARVTFRLDLRAAKRAIATTGRYRTPTGAVVTSLDPVYVVGDTDPLVWDVRALAPGAAQQLRDPDGDGVYETTLVFRTQYTRPLASNGAAQWSRTASVSAFPSIETPQPLWDALWRMSHEELTELRRPDGALAAGAKWPGVWTRDVSFASLLSLAIIVPDAVKTSLLAKVDSSGRIIQDTGTGGSWPISTDRMTWALAAWEVYAATGDRPWLERAYAILERSVVADRHAAVDASTGLMLGESSFLDWREQSYPAWMQPADIFQSMALGTNAVHVGAYRVGGEMARALGRDPSRWDAWRDSTASAMNRVLWSARDQRYAQFRYGRLAPSLSRRSESLGAALALLTGAVPRDRQVPLVSHTPVVAFGAPTFWPYTGGVPFYHNATVWPFVAAFWTWAAADARHTAAVEHGLATLARAPALFLTNKENLVAETGHFEGTALNSDRQLWSVAGTLAAQLRVLFGVRLDRDSLRFAPMVPPQYAGVRTLRDLRWRGATLEVEVRGSGAGVRRALLDGAVLPTAAIPATLTGAHRVELELDGTWPASSVTTVADVIAPATPVLARSGASLRWEGVSGAARYVVHRNGRPVDTLGQTARRYAVASVERAEDWQLEALSSSGVASFLSEPVRVEPPAAVLEAKPEGATERAHDGFTGAGYLTLDAGQGTVARAVLRVPKSGTYAVEVRYANGNGPINTEDKAAIRTLRLDGQDLGVVVMPQRGGGAWNQWGWSNRLSVRLAPGTHVVELRFDPRDRNMNGVVNVALVDLVRLTRIE
jgi:hypothetical protein